MELRLQCKDFLLKIVVKLLEKCPLKYPLTNNMSCLDPRQMVASKAGCLTRMRKILTAQERWCLCM